MSENNPFASPENKDGQQHSPYGGYTDPAAQYSAQNNSEYAQNNAPQTSGQPNPAYGQQTQDPYGQQAPGYGQQQQAYGQQPPAYGQPAYGAPTYGAPAYGQPNGFDQAALAQIQGQKDAQSSLIMGIIGLVLGLGLILGPLGIHFAKKAERANVSATAGKVLGWINLILALFVALMIVLMILGFAGVLGSEFATELNNEFTSM